jgi:predicted enzyme related to lactoylglutathione lyase
MKPLRLLLAVALLTAPAHAQQSQTAQQGGTMTPAPIVFFDIAGPADAKLAGFYKTVFGWETGPTGNLSVPIAGPPLNGTFRTDPTEKVIYIGVSDVTATLAQVIANGGKAHAPRFEVPGVVVLGLFFDPAGNRMGLVEMGADGKAKIP